MALSEVDRPVPDPEFPDPGRYEPGYRVSFWPIPVAIAGVFLLIMIVAFVS